MTHEPLKSIDRQIHVLKTKLAARKGIKNYAASCAQIGQELRRLEEQRKTIMGENDEQETATENGQP